MELSHKNLLLSVLTYNFSSGGLVRIRPRRPFPGKAELSASRTYSLHFSDSEEGAGLGR